jgi:hypothetical protein
VRIGTCANNDEVLRLMKFVGRKVGERKYQLLINVGSIKSTLEKLESTRFNDFASWGCRRDQSH